MPPDSSPAPLAITYLVEEAIHPWGGVKTIFRQADELASRGHRVTILCRSERPTWHEPICEFRQVARFDHGIPESDLLVGTWCTTVPVALCANQGRAVHLCQGYEGDDANHDEQLWNIERIYRMPTDKITISPFVGRRLSKLFGDQVRVVPYGIHDEMFSPNPNARAEGRLRVGLIGPWSVEWKDIPTGIRAVQLASHELDVTLVRVSPGPICDDERNAWQGLDVEAHEALPLDQMPEIYRSLDLFLGTSTGGGEGFFLPAVEAMACGVPCVLSDIECFRHYGPERFEREPDFAYFVNAGDDTAFAHAIRHLAQDSAMRECLREAGIRTAASHSFSSHVDAIESCFYEIFADKLTDEQARERRTAALAHRILEHALQERVDARVPAAEASALAVTTLAPSSIDGWLARARFSAECGRLVDARRHFARAAELGPPTPETQQLAARIELASGRLASAHRLFENAIELGHPGVSVRRELAATRRLIDTRPSRPASEMIHR